MYHLWLCSSAIVVSFLSLAISCLVCECFACTHNAMWWTLSFRSCFPHILHVSVSVRDTHSMLMSVNCPRQREAHEHTNKNIIRKFRWKWTRFLFHLFCHSEPIELSATFCSRASSIAGPRGVQVSAMTILQPFPLCVRALARTYQPLYATHWLDPYYSRTLFCCKRPSNEQPETQSKLLRFIEHNQTKRRRRTFFRPFIVICQAAMSNRRSDAMPLSLSKNVCHLITLHRLWWWMSRGICRWNANLYK